MSLKKSFKLALIVLFIGIVSGALSSAFLHLLNVVTVFRENHSYLIFGLPLFGLAFALILKWIPHHINQGVPYILQELENEKATVSPWMAPFIFLSSLGTHLFGGSAGREGVGVIMGASAAHILPVFRSDLSNLRRYFIYAGISAGFSSIFGTPIAAIVFALELFGFKHIKHLDILFCTAIASLAGLIIPYYFGPAHHNFIVQAQLEEFIPYLLIAGVISGLGAHFFYWGYKGYTKLISHLFPHLMAKLGMGCLFISLLVYFTNGYQYIGIGFDVIRNSFLTEMSYYDFSMKALFTIMTLSIGLKGGEVTPLFFMGATLSNWTSSLLGYKNFALSSALGMVALFGAVTGTPLASAVMGAELFGWKVGAICFVSCYLARLIMGNRTVYRH